MNQIYKIGDEVEVWDNRNGVFRQAKVVKAELDYICCKGTDNEHVHEVTYDVQFTDRMSKGHLPHAIRGRGEAGG